jgi:hypothetical protein
LTGGVQPPPSVLPPKEEGGYSDNLSPSGSESLLRTGADWLRLGPISWRGEVLPISLICLFLSLIELFLKLRSTPPWFDGTLESNHHLLMARAYTNNEQSRLFQFLIPEAFVRLFGVSVVHAYALQRLLFVWLSFVLFHVYLRHWFRRGAAFAGVCLLAAILPFTFLPDLQESAPFLMVSFLCGLWAIRAERPILFALALVVGALNNETTLVLPAVYFFYHFCGWGLRSLWAVAWRTAVVAAPAYLVTIGIRYVNRDRPHLGGALHISDNAAGVWSNLQFRLDRDFFTAYNYLSLFIFFGALFLYAYLHWSRKPRFLRAALLMVPLFVLSNFITGIISEVRQMVPLAYVIIPAAFFWLFEDEVIVAQP